VEKEAGNAPNKFNKNKIETEKKSHANVCVKLKNAEGST
jgi:hypothetical protein